MVIATSGKIGSGKTTWSKEYAKNNHFCYLCIDDVILNLFDKCLGENHQAMTLKIENYFFEVIKQNEESSINTIIDDGYFTIERRNRLKDFCNTNNIKLEFKFFDLSFEERLKRVNERNKKNLLSKRREFIITEEKLRFFDSLYEEDIYEN